MPNPADAGLPNPANYVPSSGNVLDMVTGLTWEGSVNASLLRQFEAVDHCKGKGPGWRLPTRVELASLVDFTVVNPNENTTPDPTTLKPTINAIFTNTPAKRFWTSSHRPCDPTYWWWVGFDYGNTHPIAATDTTAYGVRCVRGTPSRCPATRYYPFQPGAVHDGATGLTWQYPMDQTLRAWSDAVMSCPSGAGWRVPSLTELQSLVDDTKQNPSIDGAFPDTSPNDDSYFWTSSPYPGDPAYAYYVTFIHGHADIQPRTTLSYVRCVRWDGP
jgi:hypothetical protein